MDFLAFVAIVGLVLFFTPIAVAIRIFMRLGEHEREIDRLIVRIGHLENGLSEAPSREQTAPRRAAAESAPVDNTKTPAVEPLPSPDIPSAAAAPSEAPPPRAIPPTPLAPPEPVLRRLGPDATFDVDAAAASVEAEPLERWIGTHWLLYVGGAAIVIGIAYFEKLAFENHWIGETARVLQGAAAGAALICTGWYFVRRGYALYGQMLAGCGAAALYVSTYAAFNFYHLIDR